MCVCMCVVRACVLRVQSFKFNVVLFLRRRGCFVVFFFFVKTKQFVNYDDGSKFCGRP